MAWSSGGLYLSVNLTSWPTWYKEKPFSFSRGSWESDGKQQHGWSSQAREMNGSKYVSNHMREKLLLPSASLWALTNTGKAFWSDFFMGSKFFYQNGMKKAGGGGHGVLIAEVFFYWNEFLKQSIQSCAIAPHERDVAECCHSTAWSV